MPSLFTVQVVVVPLPEGPGAGATQAKFASRFAGDAARSHRQGIEAFQVGRYDEAAEHLALAAAHEETAERWNDWGVAQLKDGRPKEAMYAFQLAAHLNPRDTQAVANRNHCRKLLDEGMVPAPVDRGLSRLVAALPEVYQPIFGHPEWSAQASRGCQDRLVWIERIYRLLEAKLNRPLRVLDLGCAQGYFSLSLAALGAEVIGIDFEACNIAVCNTLAAGHADWKVRFRTGTVEHVIANLTSASGFDLVLGLSVFHHIVHRVGIDAVRTMLSTVAENTAASIFEMALAAEPPCWAASQPANPRQLLDGFAFVHEIARNPTHLSELTRPLYVASNKYWFLGDRVEAFDSWKTESHAFAGGTACGTRRYFFGNGLVAKVFDLEVENRSEINRRENLREAALLRHPPPGFAVPKLLSDGRSEREAWLVREHVPGELLLDRIRSGISCDSRRVLADILDQLVNLESAGLYHDDIRTWNVLIGPDDRASLIDFGAISPARVDCVWPHDIFLAFLITVQEIANGEVLDSNPREPLLNPATLPEPYRAVWRVFLEQPLEQWSFALLRDLMERGWRGEIADPGDWPAGLALIVGALMAGCSKSAPPPTVVISPPDPQALALEEAGQLHRDALALFEQGQKAAALASLDQALSRHETGERWNDWAAIQTALGHLPKAEEGFRKALDLEPWNPHTLVNLGTLLLLGGRQTEAWPLLTNGFRNSNVAQRQKLIESLKKVAPLDEGVLGSLVETMPGEPVRETAMFF